MALAWKAGTLLDVSKRQAEDAHLPVEGVHRQSEDPDGDEAPQPGAAGCSAQG